MFPFGSRLYVQYNTATHVVNIKFNLQSDNELEITMWWYHLKRFKLTEFICFSGNYFILLFQIYYETDIYALLLVEKNSALQHYSLRHDLYINYLTLSSAASQMASFPLVQDCPTRGQRAKCEPPNPSLRNV